MRLTQYHKDYQSMKISFGKDRCGNPPRFLGKMPMAWSGNASASRPHSPPDSSRGSGEHSVDDMEGTPIADTQDASSTS